MQVPRACMILCQKDLSSKEARKFRNFIDDEYRVSLVLDTLPVTMTVQGEDEMEEPYSVRGYPVGFVDESSGHKRYYLYNHLRFTIYFNEDPAMYRPDLPGGESQAHVVGFEVVPISIKHQFDKRASGTVTADTVLETCNEMHHASNQLDTLLSIDGPTEVIFTYDLIWQRSDLHWTERWDVYLRSGPADNVHWFSIINSALVTVFLAAMVAMILIRALRRDILAYNEDDDDDSGWKLMHTEVFRPPTYGKVAFSVIVGTGIQPGQPRIPRDVAPGLLCLHGHRRRVLLGANVQDVPGDELALDNRVHGDRFPRLLLRLLLHCGHGAGSTGVQRGGSRAHVVHLDRDVLRRERAAGLRRQLQGLPGRPAGASVPRQPHCEEDPGAALVLPPGCRDGVRGHPTLRCGQRRALLPHVGHLVESALLHLRLPLNDDDHPRDHLCGAEHRGVLLPALLGEPSMVVELHRDARRVGPVRVGVLHVVLSAGDGHLRGRAVSDLFRLHDSAEHVLLPGDGILWVSRHPGVRKGDL
eukprot:scaffold358_cov256-Pinguiococcus_pyrenoidosus.AAC.25